VILQANAVQFNFTPQDRNTAIESFVCVIPVVGRVDTVTPNFWHDLPEVSKRMAELVK
jgi:hypothetical protein